ncbi:MAG: cation-transporting P-type ATPase, partial [Lachnospiraceae bacterium]|nr:cation-transporting P-type ATPase [Lachnospiraceae bacterium]
MMKRINDFLAGLLMTIVGGTFLIMSFIFSKINIVLPGNVLPFDPAWITVFICGIPLLYLAVWRLI